MRVNAARAMPGQGGMLIGCLLVLMGLFAALVSTARLQPEEIHTVEVRPLSDGVFELRVELPADASQRWALWLPREPLERLQLVSGDGWHSEPLEFFAVGADEGILPNGYRFLLPRDAQGPMVVQAHVEGALHDGFRPVLAEASDIRRVEASGVALAGAVYGGLLTLAALALALAYASRDRLFIGLFGFIVPLVLLLQALNGHLYALPGVRLFGLWGLQGLSSLTLIHAAAALWMVEAYATNGRKHRHARLVRGGGVALIGLAALFLLNLPWLERLSQTVSAVAWTVASAAALAMLMDAGRRGVPMAWALTVAGAVSIGAGLWLALSRHGLVTGGPLLYFSYQGAAVAFALVFALALTHRIGDYREARDRDRLARLDTERRMRRESARADLSTALQSQLSGLDPGEIPWQGFRLLVDHLLPLVPTESCIAVLRGYQGRDHLLVEPSDALPAVEHEIGRRGLVLRRQATAGLALQQPVRPSAGGPVVAMEALVPFQVRAPGWGVLLLRRAGGDGFTTDEMSLIGELARVVQLQVDQAAAAVRLRRSAEMDALTGSMNRRTIDIWIERTFAEAERSGRPVSVLFIDLDHFKSVNDRFGHATGDDCLREVSTALRGVLSDADMFGRYGGEEFIAVLPGRDGADARAVGERMRSAVENVDVRHEGQRVGLTVSIGIATRQRGEDSAAAAVARADKALYAAKRQGRNCVQVAPAIFS